MPSIEGLDPGLQTVGTALFVIAVAVFAAWSTVFGRKPKATETREFSVSGQLADMSPVKELVEQTGLLVQQQVRTNMVLERVAGGLEACAKALQAASEAYAGEIAARATEEEIEERAQLKFEREMERERRARRRAAPRKKPPT